MTMSAMGGNRFTKDPTVTRDDPRMTVRLSAELLGAFRHAADREGVSLSAWITEAGEKHLSTSRERLRARKAGGQ